MSFGYSVGDFIGLPAMAWKVYTNLSMAPEKFRNLSGEVNSMHASLRLLEEALKENKLSEQEKSELCGIGKNCEVVLQDVLSMLKKFRSLGSSSRKAIDRIGFAMEDVSEMRSRLVSHTTMLISFQSGLQSRRQDTILDILIQIRNDIQTGKRARSVLTTITAEEIAEDNEDIWQVIAAEIEDAGLQGQVDESERYFIGEWIEDAISNGELESVAETQTNPDIDLASQDLVHLKPMHHPNRAPPPLPAAIDTEREDSEVSGDSYGVPSSDMTLLNDDVAVQELIEEDVSLALVKESDTIFLTHKNDKGNYPLPWSWDRHPRGGFFNRITFHRCAEVPPLELSSFSVMAYETAPRCIQTIERLEKLLQTSGMGGDIETGNWDQITNHDAFQSLKLLRGAMTRFGLLQDQDAGSTTQYSDLDALVVETNFIRDIHGEDNELLTNYPIDSVSLCQREYFSLLKEAMAFLYRFSIIFAGKTYVMEERSIIANAWNEKKMMARSRSIELKLQEWDIVEAAVRRCRNWLDSRFDRHRKDDILRLATSILVDYEQGRRVLQGYDGNHIQITVISATGLPGGSRLRPLNASFKIKTWADARFPIASRAPDVPNLYESKRAVKMNEPVWNETFTLDFNRPKSTSLEIQLWDTMLGMYNNICHCRLIYKPTNKDGDPTFAGKTLLHGYDEIKEFPLRTLNRKNQWDPAGTLKVRMKWEGHYEKLQRLGLPLSPPSDLYHTGEIPMPAWPEDGVQATEIDKQQGWIQITDKISGQQLYVDLLTNSTSWKCPDPAYDLTSNPRRLHGATLADRKII